MYIKNMASLHAITVINVGNSFTLFSQAFYNFICVFISMYIVLGGIYISDTFICSFDLVGEFRQKFR